MHVYSAYFVIFLNQIFFIKGKFAWKSGKPFAYTSWRANEPNSGLHTGYGIHTWIGDFGWNDAKYAYTTHLGKKWRPLCMRKKEGYPSMFSTAWLKPSFGIEAKAKPLFSDTDTETFDQSIASTKTKYIKITFNFCIHFKRENFFFLLLFSCRPCQSA